MVSPHHTPCWQTTPNRWRRSIWRRCSLSAICFFWIPPILSSSSKDETHVSEMGFPKPHYRFETADVLGVKPHFTLTARSRVKIMRHTISMLSVRPQGGSHGGERRYRGSEVIDREEGRSTKASNNTMAIVRPKPLNKERWQGWTNDQKHVSQRWHKEFQA